MKKIVLVFIVFLSFILSTNSLNSHAGVIMPVNWFSDSSRGYAFTTNINYSIENSRTELTENEIVSIINNWSSVTGVPVSEDTIWTDTEISIQWISLQEAISRFGSYVSDSAAFTYNSGATSTRVNNVCSGDGIDPCIDHYIYRTDLMEIYLIYDNVQSAVMSNNEWETILRHEMGHAFGYWGHHSSSIDLMYTYWYDNDVKYISSDDREHMSNIYSFR